MGLWFQTMSASACDQDFSMFENFFIGSNDTGTDVLAASVHPENLNVIENLRTLHQVFELPDSHPLLEEFEERITDDPCPYLLAIWPTGVTSNSFQQHNSGGDSSEPERRNEGETIKGTILIPCRTATRGTFTSNGSYFQVNEVFADHKSSEHPIEFPKAWISNLQKKSLYCGMTITTIFRGATEEEIQNCFMRGYICFRGFQGRLHERFHISPGAGATL